MRKPPKLSIPDSITKRIPPIHHCKLDCDCNPDIAPTVFVIFFALGSHHTWYVTQYEPDSRLCYGFVDGAFPEFGYFSLDELESLEPYVVTPEGISPRVERDAYKSPAPLSTFASQMSNAARDIIERRYKIPAPRSAKKRAKRKSA